MECTDTSFVRKASPQMWAQKRKSDELDRRPSKQCKSLIDVLILSNIWRGFFCGGDEKMDKLQGSTGW